jgi:hypothetical protein
MPYAADPNLPRCLLSVGAPQGLRRIGDSLEGRSPMKRRIAVLASLVTVMASLFVTVAPVAAAASVSASPAVLDFGKVQVGTTATLYLTITNTGTEDLAWAGLSHNPPFSADVPAGTCFTTDPIVPGETCTIAVTLSPTKPGKYASGLQAQFTLASDHNDLVATVDVTGQGRGCKGGGASCS